MIDKEEKKLYKKGIKNPNGYIKPIQFLAERIGLSVFSVFLIICLIFSFLDKKDIYSWNNLASDLGVYDTVSDNDYDFSVHFLDVGQGDCSIILCDDKVLMIDTGTSNQYNSIKEALMSLDIDTIDYMIITHQHDDHMGSASEIINNFNVKNIIMPKLSEINMVTTRSYEELLYSIKDNGVNPIPARAGDNFNLGSSNVEIFSPSKQSENLNNMSVITKITYGETSFLFQGDAEKEIEKELLNSNYELNADVLKVGHHGSKTSSINDFLKAVKPKFAIISCGADNSFGHPHLDVINRFENNNIKYFITASNGNITISSDGKNIYENIERE